MICCMIVCSICVVFVVGVVFGLSVLLMVFFVVVVFVEGEVVLNWVVNIVLGCMSIDMVVVVIVDVGGMMLILYLEIGVMVV